MTLPDLNAWISDNQNYFCLKSPSSPMVTIYGLNTTPIEKSTHASVLVCPFDAITPTYWPVIHTWKCTIPEVSHLPFPEPVEVQASNHSDTTPQQYQANVKMALDHINQNTFEKVVLAQSSVLKVNKLDVPAAFAKACNLPDSYAYLLKVGKELWIGASPELFLKSDYNTCETVALAGTRLTSNQISTWGEKEIMEQSVVATFIVDAFKKSGLTDVEVGEQFTKSLGHIQHICNPVKAQLPQNINWASLISSLQPTPALAGYPKLKALAFIKQSESFSRKLYGGFLGIMDIESVDLFVNIRCAQLFKNGAQLFAGAGINKDSIPENEWKETQNKLEVMRSILA